MPNASQPQLLTTLPGPVQSAAQEVRAELKAAFGAGLHALYLYGAVTFPESEGIGDLDYHVILTGPPTTAERDAYIAACTRLGSRPGCDDLDIWVISQAEAGASRPPQHLIQTGLRDNSWALHRAHWLAGRCVVLDGPPPASIVVPPDWPAQLEGLTAEFTFAVADPHDAYAVLNCCRIVRSLSARDVVQSKFGSAQWALEHLPADYATAIRAALNTYRGAVTEAETAVLAAGRPAIQALAGQSLGR